jgi:drug/metabolite transporter (DMT)-like permease
MRARGYLVLFALALIWGASYLFIKIALDYGVPPATLVVIRLSFSVATLGAIALARPKLLAGWRRYWRLAILVGFINIAVPYSLISWGETQIGSGTAAILNATTPLFTVLLAGVWLGSAHESLSVRRVIGVLIGFAGVAVLVGPEAFALNGLSFGVAQGELAVVGASAAYAIGALLSRRFSGSAMLVGPLCTQITALLWEIPLALTWNPPVAVPPVGALAALAALGIVGTGIAYLLYFWLIHSVGATATTMVTYLLPCTALIWGAVFLNESLSWTLLVTLALVLFGSMLTNGTFNGLFRRGRKPGKGDALVVAGTDTAPVAASGEHA